MRRVSAALLGIALCLCSATAFTQTWLTSWKEATKLSKTTGKPILVYFTGTGWCKFCNVMDQNIFDTPQFEKWAKHHVIALKIDFPKDPVWPSREIAHQNMALHERFGVQGFPSIVFLNTKQKPIAFGGYVPANAAQWTKSAEAMLKKHGY